MTKICFYCKQEKNVSQFNKNGMRNGKLRFKPFCKPCESFYVMKRKIQIIKEAYGKPLACETCGYDKNFSALEFHHLNSSEKEFSLGGPTNISISNAKKEVEKCILLCAICHRELHNPSFNKMYDI